MLFLSHFYICTLVIRFRVIDLNTFCQVLCSLLGQVDEVPRDVLHLHAVLDEGSNGALARFVGGGIIITVENVLVKHAFMVEAFDPLLPVDDLHTLLSDRGDQEKVRLQLQAQSP